MRCKRTPFIFQKAMFQHAKGHILESKRARIANPLISNKLQQHANGVSFDRNTKPPCTQTACKARRN